MKGIRKITEPEILAKITKEISGKITGPYKGDAHPCCKIRIRLQDMQGFGKSYLYNFPGSYDIGLIAGIQTYGKAEELIQVLEIAEKILKIIGMSALAFTVNGGFIWEKEVSELGFKRSFKGNNPHSGRRTRFFIKEL